MASLVGKALARRPRAAMTGPSTGLLNIPGLATSQSPDEALLRAFGTNGTAYANVSILARSTAKPKWALYRKAPVDGRRRYTTSDQGSDQRVEVVNHQALTVLKRPAVITSQGRQVTVFTRFKLFELSQIWLDATGKSHWLVDFGQATFPLGLWPVRPDRMTPVPGPGRVLAGWVYTSPDGREQVPFWPHEVIFNSYPDPLDPLSGAGPLGSVLTSLDVAKYADEHNRNYFLNSAEPGGVVQVPDQLSDDEFNALVNRWREAHRGVSRAHRVAVLDAGQTWIEKGHTAKDGDFVNLRNLARDLVREALAMHKIMTGVSDDVNRANAQTGEEIFAAWQVAPRLDRWRDVLNHQFLPLFGSAGEDVEFDYSYPMPRNREEDRMELLAKAAAALDLVTAGFDQHDVLEVVGLPDMKVALELSTQPALPPRWTAPAPGGEAPPAGPPAAPPVPASAARRELAAWNALAGQR